MNCISIWAGMLSSTKNSNTPQPLCNIVRYSKDLDITWIMYGPKMVILNLFCYVSVHFSLVITQIG